MAIVSAELKLYKAKTNDDTTSNGAEMTSTESVSGVSGNILPDVSEAVRTNGTTAELGGPRYRKVFFKNTNIESGPLSLTNPRVYMTKYTNGADWATFFPVVGDDNEVASAIVGTETQYGVCDLATSITGGTTATVVVTLEDSSNNDIFNDGDTIRLYDSNTTNEEFITVTTAAAPVGTAQTLTCSGNVVNSYVNTTTTVATVYEHTPAVVADKSIAAATGPGTGTLSDVTVNNIGCVEDVWTFVFDSDTTYTVTGNITGTPAGNSGNISTTFTLNNPDFPGQPYLEISAAQWGAGWLDTDQVVVTTYASAIALWVKQEVPAGAAAITSNTFKLIIDGETV